MIQSSVVVEGAKLKWYVQMWLICPDGTQLVAGDSGYWLRSPRDAALRRTGTAANLQAAMEETSRGQQLGGREWLRLLAADGGDGVLVYVYPVNDEWRFMLKIGKEAQFVEKRASEEEAKRDAEIMLNKARMRATMPSVAQTWGRG